MSEGAKVIADIRPRPSGTPTVDRERRRGEGHVDEPLDPDGYWWGDLDIDFYQTHFGTPVV